MTDETMGPKSDKLDQPPLSGVGEFNKYNFQRVIKVFLWSAASAIVIVLIDLIPSIDIPAQYGFLVTIANTILYALKDWLTEQKETVEISFQE